MHAPAWDTVSLCAALWGECTVRADLWREQSSTWRGGHLCHCEWGSRETRGRLEEWMRAAQGGLQPVGRAR